MAWIGILQGNKTLLGRTRRSEYLNLILALDSIRMADAPLISKYPLCGLRTNSRNPLRKMDEDSVRLESGVLFHRVGSLNLIHNRRKYQIITGGLI